MIIGGKKPEPMGETTSSSSEIAPKKRVILDIKAEVAKLKTMYNESGRERYNLIVYGDKGSGKTTLFSTVRKPAFIDCFDPGGHMVLRKEIEEGSIVVDTRWEKDDPSNPTAFDQWEKVFKERVAGGFFNHFATYGWDSLTTFSQIIMNSVLKKQGRTNGIPNTGKGGDNDYIHQMLKLENSLALAFSLPCDLIVTAHPDAEKDETVGKVFIQPLITGKAKIRIPLLFDEMYYAQAQETKDGVEYSLLTRLTRNFKASSRLARGAKIEMYEKPDIKLILRKAGLPAEDKPKPWFE